LLSTPKMNRKKDPRLLEEVGDLNLP
jgi:hypothetical protein